MDKERAIERRDFLKSAAAAAVLAGAVPLVAQADETPKGTTEKQNDQSPVAGQTALVGLEAPDCIAALVRDLGHVRSLCVFEAPVEAPAQKRTIANGYYYEFKRGDGAITLTADEERILSKALKLRADSKMPFWDAVLIACHDEEKVPAGLLDAALFHRGAADLAKGQSITREQVLAGAVKQICQTAGDSKWVGMTSEVVLDDGTTAHLPLLVFRCPISPHNRRLVAEVAKRLLPGGAVILETGASYQAYGRNTIPASAFAPLLGKALLLSHIVKHRYIAHGLIDGKCIVGLSARGPKRTVPVSVEVV
jgi:hypothetical protein